MAGDWIKFEIATHEKPEVWAIADALDIDPDAVVGKLLRVWSWFDQHTESGNAPTVTKKLLDRHVCVPGFSDAVIAAGWMLERDGSIFLPNFDRHNGKTAKTRATTAKRVAAHKARERQGNDKGNAEGNGSGNDAGVSGALPREEKRRRKRNTPPVSPQESSSETTRRSSSGSRLPGDWVLPDDWRQWAVGESGWSGERIDAIAERFRDHWISVPGAKGRKANWLATWRNWVRRDLENNHGNRRPQSSTNGNRDQVRAAVTDVADTSWADGLWPDEARP